jgi:hypothetical protein
MKIEGSMIVPILSMLLTFAPLCGVPTSPLCDTAWVSPLSPQSPGTPGRWTVRRVEYGYLISDARTSLYIGDSGQPGRMRNGDAILWQGQYLPALERDRWGYRDEVVLARSGTRLVGIKVEGAVSDAEAVADDVDAWLCGIQGIDPPDLSAIAEATLVTDSSYALSDALALATSLKVLMPVLGLASVTVELGTEAGIMRAVAVAPDPDDGSLRMQSVAIRIQRMRNSDTSLALVQEAAPFGSSSFRITADSARLQIETTPSVAGDAVSAWAERIRKIFAR